MDINIYDHTTMPYKYLYGSGIITYRIYKDSLYLRYVKGKVTNKQKKSVEDLIKFSDINSIHYDIYNQNGDMIKNNSIKIYGYEYTKIFEKNNINIGKIIQEVLNNKK